jgi:calnexin
MFGPDFCDNFMDKVQFIVHTRNPETGVYEESRLKNSPPIENDRLGHLYTLILDNRSFQVCVDADQVINGTLDADFESSVNPEFVDDYSERRPRDWNDNEKLVVPDPRRKRPPLGWLLDVPPQIPDPAGTDLLVPNPACKKAPGCGPWTRPIVTRTRGPWRRPKIRNSHFAPPKIPDLPDVIGAGFELWIVTRDIGIGNVWIGDDERKVRQWNEVHFIPKHDKELLMEEGRTDNDKILLQTTSTPKPKPTNVDCKSALAYFGYSLKDAVTEFVGRGREGGILIFGAVAIVPLGIWACASWCGRATRRDGRERRRKRKEAAKSD